MHALKSGNTTMMMSNFAELPVLLKTNHSYTSIEDNMDILEFKRKEVKINTKEDFTYISITKKNQTTVHP